jgi:hypothetical protein
VTCSECHFLLELFQRATIDFVSQTHVSRLVQVGGEPERFAKERKREQEREEALMKALLKLNDHRRRHIK